MKRSLPFLLVLLVPAPSVPGQEPPPPQKTKETKETKAADDPAAKDKPKERPRLKKLKQLQFDRRASAILNAWSKPPHKEPPKKDAEPKEAKTDKEQERLEAELAGFQRDVTLGNWPRVAMYLAGLPPEEGKIAYKQLLQSLAGGQGGGVGPLPGLPPQVVQMLQQIARFKEKNQFTVDDLFGL